MRQTFRAPTGPVLSLEETRWLFARSTALLQLGSRAHHAIW